MLQSFQWAVIDLWQHGREPVAGQALAVKAFFDTATEASAFIETLPDHLEGRYALDDPYDEDGSYPDEYDDDDGLTDAEADAMTLAGAGWGSDEDYGYYGEDDYYG